MFCYLVLIVNIVFFIWCGILVHKIEKDPEYQKWKQFADGMNEVTRLIKEAKYYAKKSKGAKAYEELAKEMVKREKKKARENAPKDKE